MPSSVAGLRRHISACHKRVDDARFIAWKALEQSWTRELEQAEAALAALGIEPPKRPIPHVLPPASAGRPVPTPRAHPRRRAA